MNKTLLFIAGLFIMSLTACSDDDKGKEPGLDFGDIKFTVTGEIENDFSGMADFHHLIISSTSTEIWSIDGNDYNPQTFSIGISDMAINSSTERPSAGTYTIGSSVDAHYSVVFLYFPDGPFSENTLEYSTTLFSDIQGGGENRGTLTITSSNENTVKGHFEFTAYREDDELNIAGTIYVEGEFTANKRI